MPEFRTDLDAIPVYSPGKSTEEVMAEQGITEIVKLASNECAEPPFPEVVAAIAAAAPGINRYPDTTNRNLVAALAAHHQLEAARIIVSAGSTQLLGAAALAVGGAGTATVFADPSFVMYDIWGRLAGSELLRVPLDAAMTHDPDALADAVTTDTTLLYVCNPNNPTGTYLPYETLAEMVRRIPDRVLVVIDEAYGEYATAPDYASAVPLTMASDNVVVTRTFSKIYGLAGLRVGYAIGDPGTLDMLRRTQAPFAVTSLAQVAALEALRHPALVDKRVKDNVTGRDWLRAELGERGVVVFPSEANFLYTVPAGDAASLTASLLEQGVIVRLFDSAIRITVGTERENERLMAAWDVAHA